MQGSAVNRQLPLLISPTTSSKAQRSRTVLIATTADGSPRSENCRLRSVRRMADWFVGADVGLKPVEYLSRF
jgi:hypothetical protein